MILGILLLLGGFACLVMAVLRLRGPGDAIRAQAAMRLVIGPTPGRDETRILLHRGDGVAFGPHPARWDPASSLTAGGSWRVAAAVDLGAEDALGTGDPRLAAALRRAVGQRALVLEPVSGGRPVLLHAGGSAGGIGIKRAHLDALIALLGDPTGLQVELVRRRVQRAGWGVAQDHRRRARQ